MTEEIGGRLHPLAVLLIARRFLGVSLIPAAAVLLSAGTRVIVPLLAVALLVGVPLAVLSWLRFRYRVAGGRLELHSGVVSHNVRTIPLERLRGVDVTAPFLHRLLGLVKVEVEAAAGGGSRAELSLAAVSREEAERLREVLLRVPREREAEEAPPRRRLYRATPGLLALGGVTSMRYLLAPAAVVGFVFNLGDDLPGDVAERAADAAADRAPTDPVLIAVLAVAAVAAVVLVAAAGSLLVDWEFTLEDDGERLTARRGLLTRRLVQLDRNRIRGLDLRDTPLRRPFGIAAVTAIAAGLRGRTGGTTLAPVARTGGVAALLRAVDPEAADPQAPLASHPMAARTRRLVRALPLPLLFLVAATAALAPWAIVAAATFTALAVLVALDRYRQLGHAFDGRRLTLRGGSLLRRWSEVDPAAAVTFEVRSSPGQRRAGVCTLTLHLGQGAGSRRALDIGEDQAAELVARLDSRLLGPLVAAPNTT